MLTRTIFDSDVWRLRFARLQDRARRARSAETFYRAILRRQPRQAAALTGLGRQLLRQRRYDEAAIVWQQVVAARPDATGARFQLARSYHRQGLLADAAAEYLRVVARVPGHDKARAALATLAVRLARAWPENGGDPDAAMRICQTIREDDGETEPLREAVAAAFVTLAAAARSAEPERALGLFDMALGLIPDLPGALRGAAYCQERLGRPGAAAALWDRLARAFPDSVEAAMHRDRTVATTVKRDSAAVPAVVGQAEIVAMPSVAGEEMPRAATARAVMERLLGEAHAALDREKPTIALAFARRAFSFDEGNAAALDILVRALIAAGRWSEAATQVRAVTETRPDAAWALTILLLADDAATADPVAAARLADRAGLQEQAARFYEQALSTAPSSHLALETARFYTRAEQSEAAVAAWSRLLETPDLAAEALDNISRLHAAADRPQAAIALIAQRGPDLLAEIDARPPREQNSIVRIVARYLHCCLVLGDRPAMTRLLDLLGTVGGAGPCACCLRARLLDGLGRKDDADAQLSLAARSERQIPAEVAINLRGERCLHAIRYGLFGEVIGDADTIAAAAADPADFYQSNFRVAAAVLSRFGGDREMLYPEVLLDEIMRRSAANPIPYEAVPRKVVMVAGSLGQGGGEKQTVTVLRRFAEGPEAADLFLAVRTVDRRPSDDFFLPTVAALGLRWMVYGDNWGEPHLSAGLLPELADDTIAAAIDLAPHSVREELLRVARLILDERPETVHIWQDMPIVAVACLLCGVPRFFLHRGSLSPDYWQFNDYQWHTHFRPMQFVYRRLVRQPGFFFLNNCDVGCRTDANWIGVPRDERFRVLYNAVEFGSLGAAAGPNLALRRELGIPDTAPVLGGSFRVVAVKRPLLWIEAARLVLRALPDAHFVIIGGGDLTDDVVAQAEIHGFRERLHLPGRVADVGAWYRVMDVMMLTSEREGIPNAIIEAQHFGVPVVATDVGGIAEAIEPGATGHVVGNATAENFARRVVAILTDPPWRDRARAEAPRFVHERFSLDRVLAQLRACYGWE